MTHINRQTHVTNAAASRRTSITIETHSITIIRTNDRRFSRYCARCDETVSAFTPEQLAIFMNLDPAEVCRRIDTGEFHLTETGRTIARVCGNSSKRAQLSY